MIERQRLQLRRERGFVEPDLAELKLNCGHEHLGEQPAEVAECPPVTELRGVWGPADPTRGEAWSGVVARRLWGGRW